MRNNNDEKKAYTVRTITLKTAFTHICADPSLQDTDLRQAAAGKYPDQVEFTVKGDQSYQEVISTINPEPSTQYKKQFSKQRPSKLTSIFEQAEAWRTTSEDSRSPTPNNYRSSSSPTRLFACTDSPAKKSLSKSLTILELLQKTNSTNNNSTP